MLINEWIHSSYHVKTLQKNYRDICYICYRKWVICVSDDIVQLITVQFMTTVKYIP